MKKRESKISPIQFNPNDEYSFWFWRHKFHMVFEMLALLIDYEFAEGELEGNISGLEGTNNEDDSKWFSSGLHYGKKHAIYIKIAQDAEDRDIIHIFIAFNSVLKERIEFIDKLQCSYKWMEKN
jgi:CO dehydrogenase/acetyl-CoA synthase beta subunit